MAMGMSQRSLPELIADWLSLNIRLLITPGGTAVRAAHQATDHVSIVLVGAVTREASASQTAWHDPVAT
jgi:hypothetical protein